MSTAADTVQNQNCAQKVAAVIQQQRRLLTRFESVSHYLGGVCAGMYLPGIDNTFDNPVRSVVGRRRPPLLTLEVTDSGDLNFSGAISRLRNGKLVYTPIFSYDLTLLYTPRGGGRVLPANNFVLARRANDMLHAIVAYGRRVSFGTHEAVSELAFPRVIRDGGQIVAEDYSPVLGLEIDNPVQGIETVVVRHKNPAAKILARRGIDYPLSVNSLELDELVTEFRSMFSDHEIDWSVAVSALLFQHDQFEFPISLSDALVVAPGAVVQAMRNNLLPRYSRDVSDNDLLAAARNPAEPLKISRFSRVQLFAAENAADLPADYSGTVLAPVNWLPPSEGGSGPVLTIATA